MEPECPRGAELTELVTDHRFGHVHRDMLASVVHGDRVADHVGDDRGAARPGLDDPALAGRVLSVDLLEQVLVDERTLLETARHAFLPFALPATLAGTATTDDELGAGLLRAPRAALGLAPGRDRRAASGTAAFATAERVVDRVHGDAARLRLDAPPAVAAGLADLDELVLAVADLTDRGAAVDRHPTHLGRGHAQRGVVALLGDQLHGHAGGAADLAALAGAQLDVVENRADRDVPEREGVAGLDVGAMARLDRVADREPLGSEDVRLVAVGVVQQRDPAGAIGVVLDRGDLGGHTVLGALEVDHAVALLVTAADVTRRLASVDVAAAGLRLLGEQ